MINSITYKDHDKIPCQQNVLLPALFPAQSEKLSVFLYGSIFSVQFDYITSCKKQKASK